MCKSSNGAVGRRSNLSTLVHAGDVHDDTRRDAELRGSGGPGWAVHRGLRHLVTRCNSIGPNVETVCDFEKFIVSGGPSKFGGPVLGCF